MRGDPLAPQTLALGRLLDQYGAAALDAALADALTRGALNAASVGAGPEESDQEGSDGPAE